MRTSRGMGAMRTSKMPTGRTITRKDNPDTVRMFGAGGSAKKSIPREEPSRPLTAEEMRRARPKPDGVKVPDRLFQGESERGDDLIRDKKAKGGKVIWIKGAIKTPGALRKQLGVGKGEKIPANKLAKAAKASGKLGRRARFAQTLAGMKKR